MTEKYIDFFTALSAINVDVNGAIERFIGNDKMYVKFLLKFANEQRMNEIYEAFEQNNVDNMILYIHKLKGVSGNLGINDIFDVTSLAIQTFRTDPTANIHEQILQIDKLYTKTANTIKDNQPQDN